MFCVKTAWLANLFSRNTATSLTHTDMRWHRPNIVVFFGNGRWFAIIPDFLAYRGISNGWQYFSGETSIFKPIKVVRFRSKYLSFSSNYNEACCYADSALVLHPLDGAPRQLLLLAASWRTAELSRIERSDCTVFDWGHLLLLYLEHNYRVVQHRM